ncbi:DegT/DnrJ/EryC1/StrS family aminotransferase [Salinirubrum litoreum]|uniref:DegT/DnrJ/EryC1/StrS family aminotransferase n=1 Tax=Salinirubrum litoreum TaxID=1126234 RepID=A0ABD5RDU1_9EURY|nr:DegT/DnrJ/EryC1/StrS family aminotransferase [Salinirubrum litoreum]
MAQVPFTDIYVDDDIVERASDVLRSGRYVKGGELRAFEDEFADVCGTDHAVGVSSGTASILLTLQSLDVGTGDEVLVPAHTFFASVSPILTLGATPRFVEVDPETYTLDPASLRRQAERATTPVAILPVHLYGQMADPGAIRSVADDYDLAVVEDACQAHGASRDGVRAGTLGDAGCFSFYPSKNLTVAGDGGMLVTDDPELAASARRLRNHGRNEAGEHVSLGLNFRLGELPAAVGREQLRHLPTWNDARARAATEYGDRLADLAPVVTPTEHEAAEHVYHLYVVRVPAAYRDPLRDSLAEQGIETGVHYPTPAHQHPAVVDRVGETAGLARTEAICDQIVSLPMHPRITDTEIETVCDGLRQFFAENPASRPTLPTPSESRPSTTGGESA